MTDRTIDLDQHRGMSAQKATELRRILADVDAAAKALEARQEALETQLIAEPASTWEEAAEKARYLISLLALTPAARDPRRKTLIASVLEDLRQQEERHLTVVIRDDSVVPAAVGRKVDGGRAVRIQQSLAE